MAVSKTEALRNTAGDDGSAVAWAIDALAMTLPLLDAPHPNKVPFSGVLTRVDEPSDRPPSGARGRCILLPTAVAQCALPTLIGMAVDMVPDLSDHDARAKIGVITEASLQGRDLVIAGYLYGKDFPDAVAAIQEGARRGTLGASFEITDVAVEDPTAAVLTITRCTFTGAAILNKRDAAYDKTAIAASAAAEEAELMKDLKAVLEELKNVSAALAGTVEADTADADTAAVEAARVAAVKKKANEDAAAARVDTLAATMGSPLTKHIFGLGLQSLCKAMGLKGMDSEEHDDTEEDVVLMKKLGLLGTARDTTTHATSGVVKRVTQRLDDMQAAMELITDTLGKQTALLTDLSKQTKALATDDASRRDADGKLVAARKTMAATTHEPQWLSKYPEINAKEKWTEGELSALLKQHGVNEEQRMAVKLDLLELGRLT